MNHSTIKCYNRYDYAYEEDNVPQALATLNLNENREDQVFFIGFGASSHMTNTIKLNFAGEKYLMVMLMVIKSHIGIALLETPHGNLRVNDVLVVPNLKKKFFSRR